MTVIELSKREGQAAVWGGAVLGGGGGGSPHEGLRIVEEIASIGKWPKLYSVEEFEDTDLVACVAMVGAPSAQDAFVDFSKSVDAVGQLSGLMNRKLAALVTNENGGSTTVNGWYQAAMLGLPVLDCPGNGRAHPTGTMGSFSLHNEETYVSRLVLVGGRDERALESVAVGSLESVSKLARTASVIAGGLVFVCRNPIEVHQAVKNGAPRAISQARDLGHAMLAVSPGEPRIAAISEFLGGQIVAQGVVEDLELESRAGFDVGRLSVSGAQLTFWNEFMTVEMTGDRLATFPDLIALIDEESGLPVSSAEVVPGQKVSVLVVGQKELILGQTMYDKDLYAPVEAAVDKDIINYLKEK